MSFQRYRVRLHLNQKRIWCPMIRIIGSKLCLSIVFPGFATRCTRKIFHRGPDFHLRWQNVHPNLSRKWRVVQLCKCSTSVHKTVKGCFGRISVCLQAENAFFCLKTHLHSLAQKARTSYITAWKTHVTCVVLCVLQILRLPGRVLPSTTHDTCVLQAVM